MKVAARIFIIIGMIVGFWMILPIIFGAITLKKLGNGTLTTGWKVVCLIFVSLLGGIFLLCSKDTDYALNAPQANPYAQGYAQPQQIPAQDPYAQQNYYAQPQQDPYAQQNYYAQPQQAPAQDPYAQQASAQDPYAQQAPAQDPYAQQAPQQNYYNQQ